jgi:RNA polymerase sigma-70 factor (ECF subfamily)
MRRASQNLVSSFDGGRFAPAPSRRRGRAMSSHCADQTVNLILAEETRLRRVAARLTRCAADADDLVQDTLLRAFRARRRFQPGTSIRAWTTTILRRVFLTGALRAKRRRLETDTDSGEPLERVPGAVAPTSRDATLSLEALSERLEDPVKRALDRVPDVYRTPLLMSLVESLTCSEIAERLGVPDGTVMSRIHRARESMKRDLVHTQCGGRGRQSPFATA